MLLTFVPLTHFLIPNFMRNRLQFTIDKYYRPHKTLRKLRMLIQNFYLLLLFCRFPAHLSPHLYYKYCFVIL